MDLTTRYLGLNLRTPLVPSASPLSDDLDNIKRMEDAGAAAVVIHSLFEEQLLREQESLQHHLMYGTDSFAEALSFFPEAKEFAAGPDEYLNHIRKVKSALRIPVIASLNGTSIGSWIDYARKMQQAGADALELNVYHIPTDMDKSAAEVEEVYIEIVKAVKSVVSIPIALKLSPFFSNMANMAKKLDQTGINALVLFNRFYQPDMDLETLEVRPNVNLSTPQAMRLPLRWIAILYDRVKADLAGTSGIHSAHDVLKMLMAGADVTMLCSVLFKKGIEYIREIENGMCEWMEEHDYQSVRQMQGSMSQKYCSDPTAFERAQYMRAVISYKPA
ncbi:MAG TPA: dihydroorotate dehydrogenase-like protein [Acidobacteriota bacterium]|nr:dihydroorotate dehydrogenase-like protein [Acidobacteriota bacterium]